MYGIAIANKDFKNPLDQIKEKFESYKGTNRIQFFANISADYIVFCINSPLGFNWIQNHKVGGGTHTYKINLGDMPNMLIPIPPFPEQKRIKLKIEQIFAEIDKLKK